MVVKPPGSLPSHNATIARRNTLPERVLGKVLTNRMRAGRATAPIRPSMTCLIRSEEHTSELQSLMRISYAVFCLKKKTKNKETSSTKHTQTVKQHNYPEHIHTITSETKSKTPSTPH